VPGFLFGAHWPKYFLSSKPLENIHGSILAKQSKKCGTLIGSWIPAIGVPSPKN
jgi:hypothetical protein